MPSGKKNIFFCDFFLLLKKKNMAVVSLKVKPAVFRWIDNNFPKVKEKYDVRGSFLHEMICAGLVRVGNNKNAIINKHFSSWKTIDLIVSGYWVAQYGTNLTNENQCRINSALYDFLANEICTGVMNAHVLTNYPKNTLLKSYLCNLLYDENELSLACIAKIYQRKYLEKERNMRENFTESNIKLILN